MSLNFPSSPSNGQVYATSGKTYEYDSSVGAWKTKNWVQDTVFTIGGFSPGDYVASEVLMLYTTSRPFILPNGFTNSYGYAVTTATANVVLDVFKNSTQIGTITYKTSNTTPVFAGNGGSFSAGDYLKVVAPSATDASLANFSFTFKGIKN